jgi:hypothetical protein
MDKKETLARIIAKIHSYSYPPFYHEDKVDIWDELEEVSSAKNEVDKQFFRDISDYLFNIMEASNNRTENLAILLSRIHSSTLVPFYKEAEPTFEDSDEWDGYNWSKLPSSGQSDVVSKEFFRNMASDILNKLKVGSV